MLTVVAVNLVEDALRDELDPRLRSLANLVIGAPVHAILGLRVPQHLTAEQVAALRRRVRT